MIPNSLSMTPLILAFIKGWTRLENGKENIEMQKFAFKLLDDIKLHPFEPYCKQSVTPFLSKLAEHSSEAAEAVTHKFMMLRGEWVGFV